MDEFRAGLELATDEELEVLTEILFCRKFNPLDYVYTPLPAEIQSQGRHAWLDALEERFRFLAADGITVLQRKTHQVSYRQVLLQICRHLKISYSQKLSTTELEAEIFLSLLQRAWEKLPIARRQVLNRELEQVLSHAQLAHQIPPSAQHDPVGLVLKGGSALAISSVVRPLVLQLLTRQLALHAATYQAAKQVVTRGGAAIATQIQQQVTLQTASRGIVLNTARYTAVRGFFAVLGPALWTWFLADLGWRVIATNYSRVIPVVFTLAQIRLTRTDCFEPV